MKQLVTSGYLTADTKDLLKGLVVAVLTAVITVMLQSLDAGSLKFDWPTIAKVALTSGLGYILKNVLSGSKVELSNLPKEQLAAIKKGEAEVQIVSK